MSRISIVNPETATGEPRRFLDAVKSRLGVTPNLIRVLTYSPKALDIFTNLIGKATHVDIDFPKVALLAALKAA